MKGKTLRRCRINHILAVNKHASSYRCRETDKQQIQKLKIKNSIKKKSQHYTDSLMHR